MNPQLATRKLDWSPTARLLSLLIRLYTIAWTIEFIVIAMVFGTNRAMVLSLLTAIPIVVGIRMRLRWRSVNTLDFVPLGLVVVFTTWGSITVMQSWYRVDPLAEILAAQEELEARQVRLNWTQFEEYVRKDRGFRFLVIHKSRSKGPDVYWVSGKLESESDLQRLIALASKCGITDRRLDGPYPDNESITVPNLDKDKTPGSRKWSFRFLATKCKLFSSPKRSRPFLHINRSSMSSLILAKDGTLQIPHLGPLLNTSCPHGLIPAEQIAATTLA